MIPYLCPEMSREQKDALVYGVKVPLVYTNVQISNSRAFHSLGARKIRCPGAYFQSVDLDFPVSIGDYKYPANPGEPCVLHLEKIPVGPGATQRDQQIAGRTELYRTPFSTFERNIRDLLGRILSPAGFDPARDIQSITVNRWPHGYAYEYNSLYDPNFAPDQTPLRNRPPVFRPNFHCEFRRGRFRLHQRRNRRSASRSNGSRAFQRKADCIEGAKSFLIAVQILLRSIPGDFFHLRARDCSERVLKGLSTEITLLSLPQFCTFVQLFTRTPLAQTASGDSRAWDS